MQPRIATSAQRKFIGKRQNMSIANNQTFRLWQLFMPRRREISNVLGSDLFSIQVYPESFDFTSYDVNATFDRWAAAEVADFGFVPHEMETFILPAGLYAVFDYKGLSTDSTIFRYIFGTWLPESKDYVLDNRPHFEVLGEKYRNNDPQSEEEIWIPVRPA